MRSRGVTKCLRKIEPAAEETVHLAILQSQAGVGQSAGLPIRQSGGLSYTFHPPPSALQGGETHSRRVHPTRSPPRRRANRPNERTPRNRKPGAEDGSRTHTWLPTEDFESSASAIPPLRQGGRRSPGGANAGKRLMVSHCARRGVKGEKEKDEGGRMKDELWRVPTGRGRCAEGGEKQEASSRKRGKERRNEARRPYA